MPEFEVTPLDAPNLNTCIVAGIVGPQVAKAGKQYQGLRFAVRYVKRWLHGNTSTLEIPCYTSGERVAELTTWLKPGERILVQGELNPRAAIGEGGGLEVYARRVERLSPE